MDNEKTYLVLGCYGRAENNFVLCSSVQNRILELNESLVNYNSIMDYLDIMKLFDRPLLDQNAIRHLVFNLQDRFDQKIKRLWTDHEFHLIERFMHMHKPCGIYAQLILIPSSFEEDENSSEDYNISFIKGSNRVITNNERKVNLSSVRSWKYS